MATATGIPEMTLVDLGTDLLDNILRHLGVAPRDHCAAASACAALRCRYLDGAKNPLLRVFEAGKREAPTGLRAQLRELGALRGRTAYATPRNACHASPRWQRDDKMLNGL